MPRHSDPKPVTPLAAIILVGTLLLSGCDKPADQPTSNDTSTATGVTATDPALKLTTENLWRLGSLQLNKVLTNYQQLQASIDALLQAPNELTLSDAREQWHHTHNNLQLLSPFFTLGDINPGLFSQIKKSHFLIDAWPIQPGYIDYFDVYKFSGLVNDIAVPMNAETIRQQHGFSDSSDVTLGLHAMAYLLWGETGTRPATDFTANTQLDTAQKQSGMGIIDLPNNRRRTLLQLQSTLLRDDLESLRYRMTQSVSAISSAYALLGTKARLALWRQSLSQLLQHDLIATQISPLLQANHNEGHFIEHNRFAGGTAKSLAYNLKSIEQLLWHQVNESDQPLAQWLLTDTAQQEELKALLSRAVQQLETLNDSMDNHWHSPSEEQQQALQQLIDGLQQAATLIGGA